jgi:hypothetical protein
MSVEDLAGAFLPHLGPARRVAVTARLLDMYSRALHRQKVQLRNMVKLCPGKRHAWFESNVGLVRKPLAPIAEAVRKHFDRLGSHCDSCPTTPSQTASH